MATAKSKAKTPAMTLRAAHSVVLSVLPNGGGVVENISTGIGLALDADESAYRDEQKARRFEEARAYFRSKQR
jgi:hypothetical protein